MSMIFTLAVIANVILNFAVAADPQVTFWVGSLTLLPLALLMLTGLYLFALPYMRRG
jgi:hypothetical protein